MKIIRPYLKLLESYLRWFESRGERGAHARYAAACVSTVGLVINLATLMLFIRELTNARRAWPLDNLWAIFLLTALLLALNWRLVGKIPTGGVRGVAAGRDIGARPRFQLWSWYSFFSVVLLFASVLFSTR